MAKKTGDRGNTRSKLPGKVRHESQLKSTNRHRQPLSQATNAHTPLTEIRQKIRALEKLLTYDAEKTRSGIKSMPSHIRQEKERALAGYKHDLQLALEKRTRTQERSKMISKYHHVRFFERKKAERRFKQAKAAYENNEAPADDMLDAQTDLNYTLYLPLSEKYVSLWPHGNLDDPNNVREGNSWGQIAVIWSEGLANGRTEQDMVQEMLKIRDNGWPDTPRQTPVPSSGKQGQPRKPQTMPTSKTQKQVKVVKRKPGISISDNGSSLIDEKSKTETGSDSDGFFEK